MQSGSEGAESAEGTEKASGSKPQAGEKPGSKADSGKPENKGQLAAILSYHVVGQEITSDRIPAASTEVETLKGEGDRTITVVKSGSGVTVDGANVLTADIKADNGVIHVIDKVILPSD